MNRTLWHKANESRSEVNHSCIHLRRLPRKVKMNALRVPSRASVLLELLSGPKHCIVLLVIIEGIQYNKVVLFKGWLNQTKEYG